MTTFSNCRRHGALAMTLALVALAACGSGKHRVDGDTGAAAPATTIDMSATPKAGDSTLGVAPAPGGTAPAGTTDTTKRMPTPGTAPRP